MSTEQQIGELIATMKSVEFRLSEVEKDTREVRDTVLKIKGGWGLVVLQSTIASGIAVLITKLWPLMVSK